MQTNFSLFGPVHLAILAATVLAGAAFARWSRAGKVAGRRIRVGLGLFVMANELVWYGYRLAVEGNPFPFALPLHLCDLALWLTVIAALTLNQASLELAFFAGTGGAAMALLTPDLWEPFPSYPTVHFFVSHGTVLVTLAAVVLGGQGRPKPGCLRRAFLLLNVYAAAVGGFNLAFGTNYMYLCLKPASATLLDYFGPWPVYILAGEFFALAVFWGLWLPFRPRRSAAPG